MSGAGRAGGGLDAVSGVGRAGEGFRQARTDDCGWLL